MLRPRQVQRSGYLVITSDKGLAGAYSSNVLKRLINDIKESILAVTNIALLYWVNLVLISLK